MAIRTLVLAILLCVSTTSSAGWVKKWINETYVTDIAPAQQMQLDDEQLMQCDERLREYNLLVLDDPDSEYAKYHLEKWQRICE